MANIKISELNELENKHDNDLLAIVDSVSNETKKIKVENLIDEVVDSLEGNEINKAPSVRAIKEDNLGKITVEDITCKNLLPNKIESKTANGITAIKNEDGSVTFNGTATNGTTVFSFNINLVLKPGTYTHSINNSAPTGFYLSLDDINETMIGQPGNEEIATFTINSKTVYTRYSIWIPAGMSFNNYTIYPQIEKGPVATNFVEHKEYGNEIVDSGSNANGNYVKYADGTMICWGDKSHWFGFTEFTAWANAYSSGKLAMDNFPQPFVLSPIIVGSITKTEGQWGGWWTGTFEGTSPTNPGKVEFLRSTQTAANVATYFMHYMAIGFWKLDTQTRGVPTQNIENEPVEEMR